MYIKITTLVSLIGIIAVNSQEAPHRSPFTRRIFGIRRGASSVEDVKKSNSDAAEKVSGNPLIDYERAEEEIFHHVEDFEKAALNVAHNLVHDEVDILFGKDHGHAIHDENVVSDQDEKNHPTRRSRSSKKEVKQVQMSTEKEVSKEQDYGVETYKPSNSLWYCE